MVPRQVKCDVEVVGDLEVTLNDEDLGIFLEQFPELSHVRQAYISKRLVLDAVVVIKYDPSNLCHKVPLDVFMKNLEPEKYNGKITMRLSPSSISEESKKKGIAELSEIDRLLTAFIARQPYTAPAPQQRQLPTPYSV